jgi:hypothetical protein
VNRPDLLWRLMDHRQRVQEFMGAMAQGRVGPPLEAMAEDVTWRWMVVHQWRGPASSTCSAVMPGIKPASTACTRTPERALWTAGGSGYPGTPGELQGGTQTHTATQAPRQRRSWTSAVDRRRPVVSQQNPTRSVAQRAICVLSGSRRVPSGCRGTGASRRHRVGPTVLTHVR